MNNKNRQWILVRRPQGELREGDLAFRTTEYVPASVGAGEVLVRNLYCLCAPTIRNWMDEPNGLYPSIALGSVVSGPSVGRVEISQRPDIPVGAHVLSMSGWQEWATLGDRECASQVVVYPAAVDPLDCMGVYGVNALTAYFGLLSVGQPQPGETLVVSAAAGSTGSMVAQIGKIKGCTVIGIAGGEQKKRWLLDECGLDAVIDYRSEDVAVALKALCPKGVNVFYDNVGGDILGAVMANIARRGRIVLCGQVAEYNASAPNARPDFMRLVYRSARMEGFLVTNHYREAAGAIADLMRWNAEGRIRHREDVRVGFIELPTVFRDVFTGANKGTLIVDVRAAE